MDINILVDIFDYCALHPRASSVGQITVPPHLRYLHDGYIVQDPVSVVPHRYRALRLMNDHMRPGVIWRHVRDYLLSHMDALCHWGGYTKASLYPNDCVDPQMVIADRKAFFAAMIVFGQGEVFDILKICELVTSLKSQQSPDGVFYEIVHFPYWRWVREEGGEHVSVQWKPEDPACNLHTMQEDLLETLMRRSDPTEIGVAEVAWMTGYPVWRIRRECQRAIRGESRGRDALKPLSPTGHQYHFNRYQVMEWMWRTGFHTWSVADSTPAPTT